MSPSARRVLLAAIAGLILPAGCGRPYDSLNPDGGARSGDGGLPLVRSCEIRLRFQPPLSVTTVSLAGEWNGWSPTRNPLEAQPDGSWAIHLTLPKGEYGYKFVTDGTSWFFDVSNPYTKYV